MILPRNNWVRNTRSTPIHIHGRVVGHVRGDTFHKVLSSSKHFLRRPPAIAFDRCTLVDAQAAGAVRVRIFDRDTGDTYEALIGDILRHGLAVRRGYGDQVALLLSRWTKNGVAPGELAGATNQERKGLQLGLFEETTR